MKKKLPLVFVISILLIWAGGSNRQLILHRNLLVTVILFIPCFLLAYFLVKEFLNAAGTSKTNEAEIKPNKLMLWLIMVTASLTFTYAANTILDFAIIRSAKNKPQHIATCDIIYFKITSGQSEKRILKYRFEQKKYRKKLSMAEARYLGSLPAAATKQIELTLAPGWFSTNVIQQYTLK